MLGTCVGARSAREQFLQEKIDHEAATVAKLINLPHQHALLVLRACVQQNWRHLQRSLKSDD
jgi:phosphoserine aminotransferase